VSVDVDASDSALARLAVGGDDRAFARLVARHKEPLYRLLRRYTGDGDEAYEAVHEAFIAAWTALRRYDPDRRFGAWLRTIAINKARDRGRRLAFRHLLFGTLGLEQSAVLEVEDPATTADQLLMDSQLAKQVDREIQRLPAALKEAFLLTAFEGWSHQEAGHILGVSAKTIETRAYRARKLLMARLDDVLQPGSSG
jgi:RNA polymerase sigma factor (sigma-70 family)